ncbi:tyrosine-type recombinase/integrase [Streptomyces sp. NRRL S-646]|uniref:tyrosine-type recombinase/integrase n=1 Tax=Streptomyces sp. NRRL S-646 TaxID=1463917 RepID=UPI000AFFEE6A|nr:tyrosine-type recombinase/integrase [Streptomyces sp. NRRL S-646]
MPHNEQRQITEEQFHDAVLIWDYHRMGHERRPCSAAIGLGSHDLGVATTAVALYRTGFFPVVVFSGGNSPTTRARFPRGEAVHYREHALSLGVPDEAILVEPKAANTGQNITFSRELLTEAGELRSLNQPSVIQGWIRTLQDGGLEVSTIEGIFDILSSILGAAVEDGLLPRNPCKSKSVKLPTATKKKIIPWSLERVRVVIAGLPKRFQAGGKLAFGCGLRQGEVFGFAIEDIDFKGGWIHVNRQVRLVGTKPVFALPKGNRIRSVPLSAQLAAALKAHMKEFPPVEVTLPWGKPDGEPKTFRLLFVDKKGRAYNRSVFNMGDWKRALAAAGVIPPRERGARYLQAAPEDGMHALRHAYASVLLDAGESIKALSEYLGHSDPGFTLRTYTHLLPSSETRTRKAIDDVFTEAEAEADAEDEDDRPGTQGTSVPPAKPMCPQCALAA